MKVLVVGCERSGTTVISSLLSKSGKLSFLNDPEDSWYIYPLVKKVGIQGFTLSHIFRLWRNDLVKVPGYATILPELKRIHPKGYKIIYVVRDPRDVYAAIKERLDEDLNGLYLNTHFLNVRGKSICENIANRWIKYLEFALDYKKHNPRQVIFIKYEDFLEDKLKILQQLADFTNIQIDLKLIEDIIDIQANKTWSNAIKGSSRYLQDLNTEEIGIINKITEKGINEFKYKF